MAKKVSREVARIVTASEAILTQCLRAFSGKGVAAKREARGLADELATELLSVDFDDNRVSELVGRLNEFGYDRSQLEACLLSRFAFHEALGNNNKTTRDKWLTALERFGVAEFAVARAWEEGKNLYTQHHSKGEKVLAKKVYGAFFQPFKRRED
jgi:hypothetical protein